MIVAAILIGAFATAMLPLAGNIVVVAAAIALFGVASGPFDIGLFTLRQRRTDPAWFGRAFAVSMSLNSVGNPIGSAVAGPLIARSLDLALWAAVAFCLISVVFVLMIPAREGLVGEPSAAPA